VAKSKSSPQPSQGYLSSRRLHPPRDIQCRCLSLSRRSILSSSMSGSAARVGRAGRVSASDPNLGFKSSYSFRNKPACMRSGGAVASTGGKFAPFSCERSGRGVVKQAGVLDFGGVRGIGLDVVCGAGPPHAKGDLDCFTQYKMTLDHCYLMGGGNSLRMCWWE